MSETTLRRDHAAAAAVLSVLLAAVSALFFYSHVLIFVFPIMPLGAWLGWEGRNSKFRALAVAGGLVGAALTLYLAFIMLRYLAG